MNTLLKKVAGWLGRNQTTHKNSAFPSSRNSHLSMLHDGSETETRGQLVQVLLRDLVRKSGMPPGLVQCQIQVVNSRSRGQGIYLRLVVKQWDERLMTYAFAFQKALLTEIVQFEPQAGTWLHGIAWQLEVAASCPLTELPGPDFWQVPAATPEPVDQFDIIPMPANAVSMTTPVTAARLTPAALPAIAAFIVPDLPDLPESPKAVPASAALPQLDSLTPLPSLVELPAPPVDDTAQDLELLFAIRDNELASLAKDDLLPAGYENTEPLPLQTR